MASLLCAMFSTMSPWKNAVRSDGLLRHLFYLPAPLDAYWMPLQFYSPFYRLWCPPHWLPGTTVALQYLPAEGWLREPSYLRISDPEIWACNSSDCISHLFEPIPSLILFQAWSGLSDSALLLLHCKLLPWVLCMTLSNIYRSACLQNM